MTDGSNGAAPSILDLVPIAGSELRSGASGSLDSVLGKHNRISIGEPRVRALTAAGPDGPLSAEDWSRYDPATHDFHLVELSLTLLPDRACRFAAADLIVDLQDAAGDPLFLRLYPEREATLRTVTSSLEEGGKLGLKNPIVELLDVGLESKRVHREEGAVQSVHLESFGAMTSEGGWRLSMTGQREIPLDTRGLTLVTVHPRARPLSAELRVVAEIEVLSGADRWLTWAFGARPDAPVLRYSIAAGRP